MENSICGTAIMAVTPRAGSPCHALQSKDRTTRAIGKEETRMSQSMHKGALALAAAIGFAIAAAPPSRAQQEPGSSVTFKVRGAAERLEMTVNKSRVVEFPFEVPRLMVNNPDLVRV